MGEENARGREAMRKRVFKLSVEREPPRPLYTAAHLILKLLPGGATS
jgi:hypothetical protein